MSPPSKHLNKRCLAPLQSSQRSLRRQIKRFLKTLAYNIFAIGLFFLCFVFTYKSIHQKDIEIDTNENVYFQPLIGNLDFDDPSPLWQDHVQFNVPEVKAERKDWHDYAAMTADKKRIGPGEQGEPTYNKDDSKKHIEEHMALENGFNAFVSDLISVNRSVPDVRPKTCFSKRYLTKLPSVSVVIPCRNEYESVLQRTLHSIVNRSPKELLKEIIIVDDNSYRGFSIEEMTEYTNQNFPNLVQFVRLNKRRGLIYARVAGAKVATADVIVFFDSHIECNYNWLPPLLEPIAIDDRISTSPRIDVIAHENFAYQGNGEHGTRGGFNWDLTYLYMPLELDPGVDPTKPYKDPVMMGGLFAISRRFFWKLGGYDIGLDIWGAEQFELSFKIWMCGGMLLVVPCSHVAHIFRGPWQPGVIARDYDFVSTNNKRVAEVWMDEYKKYVYRTHPDVYDNLDPGDLTEQKALRERLKCKSFKWYLEFVAPDILEINPIEQAPDFANGALQSVAFPTHCLDNMNRRKGKSVGVYFCASNRSHPHANQFWNFNHRQEVKNFYLDYCLDVYQQPPNAEVLLFNCHHAGGNQFWYYDKERKWLIHGSNGNKCLEVLKDGKEFKVVANICDEANVQMRWIFGFVNETLTPTRYQLQFELLGERYMFTYKSIHQKDIEIDTNENVYFQPLIGNLDFDDPSPLWQDHVQFNVPEVKAERKDWHDYAAMTADKKRIGPGEQGEPTYNKDDSKKHIEEHMALENGFNAFVSDLISVNRSVPDVRPKTCFSKRYLTKLPSVSVVIPCRNEYESVLQRTLHSIVNRSPKELLKEIIIVDDNSYRGFSIEEMTEYTNQNFPNLVQFVFFDSHIECNYNWLPPLLEPIAIDDRISTSPRIDVIAHENFAYQGNGEHGTRGGFNWDLTYLYMPLELDPGVDPTKPYKDPVMMGGLFAISRRFFWKLGGYDIGLDIWGAEQFELSFKIWMCGGMLLVVPCSHVAHIFRGPWQPGVIARDYDFVSTNNKRVAEVWMDE